MRKIFIFSACIMLSGCTQYSYTQKLNVVEDLPDELSVTPPVNCPDWREAAEGGGLNDLHTNYGCATVTNYGVMLTNPRDMIKGRGTDADSERSRLFVRGYNSGAPSNGADAAGATSSGE